MPGTDIETITLDENIDHPLDAVLAQVDRSKSGPVMILGLERSNPLAAKERPVLYALNMSRPEWPKELPRPLVFWVPEYLLGLMGREAPDFLDWRSDTLFFRDQPAEDLLALDSGIWRGGADESMPKARREARIEELRSRLSGLQESTEDPVVLAALSSWLVEIALHQTLLGDLREAELHLRRALGIEERLSEADGIATVYNNLGMVYAKREAWDLAEPMFRRALSFHQQSGDERALARDYGNLAALKLGQAALKDAEALTCQSLMIAERLELGLDLAADYSRLAVIAWRRGDLASAKKHLLKALSFSRELGASATTAKICLDLGSLLGQEGDLAAAEALIRQALSMMAELGDRKGIARSNLLLGLVHRQRGELKKARPFWREARDLFLEMGVHSEAQRAQSWLDSLQDPEVSHP